MIIIKSIVIICDQSPIGRNSVIEAIRLGAGFLGLGEDINCKIVLTGDAVYFLSKYADPTTVGMDSLEEPLEMAELSDLEILVLDSALEDSALTTEDLIDYEKIKISNIEDITKLIEQADTSFRF